MSITREEALKLLKEYNSEPFHLRHGLTVEGVMRYFARDLGYGNEEEIMREKGIDEDIIHATASHGYNLTVDIKPEHEMEKVLYAVDELTGLIGAAVLMRPSKSSKDLELKSMKKKFKDKKFAAGCSRDVIATGADMLGWSLDDLMDKTILAMRDCEDKVNEEMGEN